MTNITKKALEASLKKMMLKKPLDKITIRDITDDCGSGYLRFDRVGLRGGRHRGPAGQKDLRYLA